MRDAERGRLGVTVAKVFGVSIRIPRTGPATAMQPCTKKKRTQLFDELDALRRSSDLEACLAPGRKAAAHHPQSRHGQTQQRQRRGFGSGLDAEIVKIHGCRGSIAIKDEPLTHESLSAETCGQSPIHLG